MRRYLFRKMVNGAGASSRLSSRRGCNQVSGI